MGVPRCAPALCVVTTVHTGNWFRGTPAWELKGAPRKEVGNPLLRAPFLLGFHKRPAKSKACLMTRQCHQDRNKAPLPWSDVVGFLLRGPAIRGKGRGDRIIVTVAISKRQCRERTRTRAHTHTARSGVAARAIGFRRPGALGRRWPRPVSGCQGLPACDREAPGRGGVDKRALSGV